MSFGRGSLVTTAAAALLAGAAALAQTPTQGPEEIVAAFHAALDSGDRTAALALLLPDVSIYEGGGAELSRDAYAASHLDADIEFSKATEENVESREVNESASVAWVLSRSRTSGTFRGRAIRSAGAETIVLKLRPEGWRIAHVHWSSRSTPP